MLCLRLEPSALASLTKLYPASVADALCAVQLLKQTRGNPDTDSAVRAWMMMLLMAATAPPGKEFVGIVSEYVHSMSHNESEVPEEIRAWAMRTWAALKRTAKAGSRQSVRLASC
jgi:hypothetical protein